MKNGILREDEGFDLVVNGVNRSFADLRHSALAGARNLKASRVNQGLKVHIRDRSTGQMIEMLEDGRTA